MMKILIYALLIIIAVVALADPEKVHHEIDLLMQDEKAIKIKTDKGMKEWEEGLLDYLFNHSSPNVRIFAIRELLLPKNINKTELSEQDINKIDELNHFISGILADESVGAQALNFLLVYCNNDNQLYQCDNDQLIHKIIEKEPNNIASYVPNLEIAVKTKDLNKISSVLSTMANLNYHNHHFTILSELELAVNDYVEGHPFSQYLIENSVGIFGFEESKYHFTQTELENNLIYSMLIGMKMAIPMHSYRVFTQTCKETASSTIECLKIADTLINNSYTLIAKKIGFSIKKEIYKKSGDDKLYLDVKKADDQFSNEYMCLSKSIYSNPNSEFLFTKEVFKSFNKVEIESGEVAGLKKLAELQYLENLNKGNQEATNPVSCYY